MNENLNEIAKHPRVKQLIDVRNIGLYIFGLLVLAITWSGAKTNQTNYQLQKKISNLNQKNDVANLENENLKLQNKFLQTDEFLDMAARRQFGKAAPGERVYVIPKSVALSYTSKIVPTPTVLKPKTQNQKSGITQNLTDWREFLLGHNAPGN